MTLADYLAKRYLTADPQPEKRSKKRKRKQQADEGLVVDDDAALDWNASRLHDQDEDGPVTVSAGSADFRRSKASGWKTIGAPAPSSAEQAAADAIIASATAENAARDAAEDESPALVGDLPDGVAKMESGAHAGLQSAEQVTAALRERQAEERARFEREGDATSGRGQETIYRDASGRIVNVAMKRAEARRKAEEEAAKKAAAEEAQKGAVQRAQRDARKQELEEAKFMTFARSADDADLNRELRERERWDDPAAQFLTRKKAGKSVTGRPLYDGAFPPNRYGIRPGHRWDGVDRGNGFERDYFAAQNRRRNHRELEYAWQLDE